MEQPQQGAGFQTDLLAELIYQHQVGSALYWNFGDRNGWGFNRSPATVSFLHINHVVLPYGSPDLIFRRSVWQNIL